MRISLTLIFLLLFYSCSHQVERTPASFASDLVGIEATFTNDTFINHSDKNPDEISDYIRALTEEVDRLCDNCKTRRAASFIGEEGVIEFEDGFRLIVERDTRVVEIVGTPIPIEDIHIHKKKIDLLIQAAHNVGLRPARSTGGGHLHFDFHKFFGGNNQLLRDFLVDSYNHSFLFNSYFGGNNLNAPTIDQLPQSSHQAFIDLIAKFDRSPSELIVFIKALLQKVFSKTMYDHLSNAQKYHAISLNQSLNGAETIEFRNVRPYQHGDQVELIAQAIIARRDFLLKNPGIKLVENHSNQLNPEEKFEEFIKYINQIGLDETKYFPLLPKETLPLVLKRTTLAQQSQYLIDFAKLTAFNDFERQISLLASLKTIDDLETQRHVLYILLEKTNQTDSFTSLIESAEELIVKHNIDPLEFLEKHASTYSLFKKDAPFDCAEGLSIILN